MAKSKKTTPENKPKYKEGDKIFVVSKIDLINLNDKDKFYNVYEGRLESGCLICEKMCLVKVKNTFAGMEFSNVFKDKEDAKKYALEKNMQILMRCEARRERRKLAKRETRHEVHFLSELENPKKEGKFNSIYIGLALFGFYHLVKLIVNLFI